MNLFVLEFYLFIIFVRYLGGMGGSLLILSKSIKGINIEGSEISTHRLEPINKRNNNKVVKHYSGPNIYLGKEQ